MFRAKLLGIVLVIGLISLGLVVSQVANAGEYVGDVNTEVLMHFNEGTGTRAYDSGPYGNHSSVYAPLPESAWTAGKYGGGLAVSSVNAWLLFVDMNGFPSPESFTYEMWIKCAPGEWGGIFLQAGYPVAGYITSDGRIGGRFYYNLYFEGATSGLNDGTWHHVAWYNDNGCCGMYVDGVLDGQECLPLGHPWRVPQFADWLQFGYALFTPQTFGGSIDELRVSTVARTAQEIAYGADILAPVAVASVTSPAIEATGVSTDVSTYLSYAGSYDPDGGNVTGVFAPVSLAVGTTTVTLTVTDDEGDTDTATVDVTVVDTTGPTITAGLVPVGGSKAEYEVVATATDLVDPAPQVIVTLGVEVEDGQRVNLPPGQGRGHFLIKGATEGVLTVVATDASGNTSIKEVPITP